MWELNTSPGSGSSQNLHRKLFFLSLPPSTPIFALVFFTCQSDFDAGTVPPRPRIRHHSQQENARANFPVEVRARPGTRFFRHSTGPGSTLVRQHVRGSGPAHGQRCIISSQSPALLRNPTTRANIFGQAQARTDVMSLTGLIFTCSRLAPAWAFPWWLARRRVGIPPDPRLHEFCLRTFFFSPGLWAKVIKEKREDVAVLMKIKIHITLISMQCGHLKVFNSMQIPAFSSHSL